MYAVCATALEDFCVFYNFEDKKSFYRQVLNTSLFFVLLTAKSEYNEQ